jgi:N,N'-diacetyllegionaminate synthase
MVVPNSHSENPLFIAEVANTHEGKKEQLGQIVDQIITNKISDVKFQVLKASDFYQSDHKNYALFKGLEFDFSVWQEIFHKIFSANITPWCDVYSIASAEKCADENIRNLKVHSSDAFNQPLLLAISNLDLDYLVLGVGGLYPFEIVDMLNIVLKKSSAQIILMQGQQGYPTKREDNNLEKVAWLAHNFGNNVQIGYADHSPGYSADAYTLSKTAIASGATVLEKHVTLNLDEKAIDHESSINIEDFNDFCRAIDPQKEQPVQSMFKLGEAELSYRKKVIKLPVYNKTKNCTEFLRESGVPPSLPRGHEFDVKDDPKIYNDGIYRRFAAIIVVRLLSHRFPQKAFAKLSNGNVLSTLVKNIRRLKLFDDVMIATTNDPSDDEIAILGAELEVPVFRGSRDNLAERFVGALDFLDNTNSNPVTHFVRMTGDNPFPLEDVHREIISTLRKDDFDYVRIRKAPIGLNTEYFNAAFFRLFAHSIEESNLTEYLTYFVNNQWEQLATKEIELPELAMLKGRYSIDYEEDLEFCNKYIEFAAEKKRSPLTVSTVSAWEASLESPYIFSPPIKQPDGARYSINWSRAYTFPKPNPFIIE